MCSGSTLIYVQYQLLWWVIWRQTVWAIPCSNEMNCNYSWIIAPFVTSSTCWGHEGGHQYNILRIFSLSSFDCLHTIIVSNQKLVGDTIWNCYKYYNWLIWFTNNKVDLPELTWTFPVCLHPPLSQWFDEVWWSRTAPNSLEPFL